jgi:hypothetical protein
LVFTASKGANLVLLQVRRSPLLVAHTERNRVGVYLSHRVLGLHKDGYGTLLGEAVFSCSRVCTNMRASVRR